MGAAEKGVVAAGHPLTAQAGARVLREGGNAVDATVAAMLTSFVTEALLTGLGGGGHMVVGRRGGELQGLDVPFGDAEQVFHIGPASCGVYGTPAGVCEAARRWGTMALEDLAA